MVQLAARVMGTLKNKRIYHAAHIAAKRASKKGCDSILERFQNCPIYRGSQLAIGWDEAFFAHYDEISIEKFTYVCTAEEHQRRENSFVLVLNSQGKNGPMKQREDKAEAIKIKERL